MATNRRKRYFQIDENASSEQIYALLDDAESADEDDIDNVMNDSDTEFIAEEEIKQATSTQDTSLTTPDVNLHVVPSDNQSKKKETQLEHDVVTTLGFGCFLVAMSDNVVTTLSQRFCQENDFKITTLLQRCVSDVITTRKN